MSNTVPTWATQLGKNLMTIFYEPFASSCLTLTNSRCYREE